MQRIKYIFDSFMPRLRRRRVRIMSVLATLLIVGLLIGGTMFFFSGRPQSLRKSGPMLVLSTQKDGLQLSAAITPGPYFRSEMLGMDLSLTNHTKSTIYAGAPFASNPCGYFSGMEISGGNEPSSQLPIELGHGCPGGFHGVALQSGKSTTVHTYEPLLSSGLLTLTVQLDFFKRTTSTNGGGTTLQPIDSLSGLQLVDPFNGHWPTTRIKVNSSVPKDHQILLERDGEHIRIDGPQGAQSDLVYGYQLTCGSAAIGDMTETGNYTWQKTSVMSINAPQDSYCAGKKIIWTYVFAAPGYAFASGTFHSP